MIDVALLERICEQGLQAVGYELVDLEYLRDQQGWVLRIYIDHPFENDVAENEAKTVEQPRLARSGISHADCAKASRHLGTLLDVEDPIDTAYRLEVSSPGVRRPLRKQRDFERFMGRQVRVEMLEPIGERRNFYGRLVAVVEGVITVDVDGQPCELPIDGVRKARLDDELPWP